MNQASDTINSLAAAENRVCESLSKARKDAEHGLRKLSRLIADKPIKSLSVAFVSGFLVARVLQKLG